ncbi:excinuclease ABC subunit UvrA [Candidatus Berkiella cookevillensis]|uniref:UvrABC system protein A n=1 Tax=Candidatus Berkiella cookevillensis TaxID=437022 RepID=A0A0Q9YNB3_9GAMM|nr:excinuclease ABC subunit UvrA [Candidatus Berkiella cookevillensis]MCS5709361.1 excinuclease ABC subunit UvrA [Candidatus Berkiella cookevillensis]
MDQITIKGARTHNLKAVDLSLPRDKLIVITGLSGSGKSSLAFDTLYAEGQRRYVESLSSYARQFLSVMEKPDVDHIEGLSPAISIEQKTTSHNPRSTVGTVTEIYDYLRLLYARVGQPKCPEHHIGLEAQTITQMVDHVLSYPEDSKIILMAPIVRDRKGEHNKLFENLKSQGFVRIRINGTFHELESVPKLDPKKKHRIEVVIDRIKVRKDLRVRLADSFETALNTSQGLAHIHNLDSNEEILFSAKYACSECGYNLPELEPRLFSFNNPAGACEHCDGLGHKQFFDPNRVVQMPDVGLASGAIRGWDRRSPYYFSILKSLAKHFDFDLETPYKNLPKKIQNLLLYGSGEEEITFSYQSDQGGVRRKKSTFEGVIPNLERRYRDTDSEFIREELARYVANQPCPECKGTRLNLYARNVFINEQPLSHVTALSITNCLSFFEKTKLKGKNKEIADKILKEISQRLKFLIDVGLNYLTLDRAAETLSGGEAQRIRLASQIGAGLVGVMYILDEPSIGLHQRDNERLLGTLKHLRDLGNTVIVVEHDEDAILCADYVVDVGPGAGVHGGSIVATGSPDKIKKAKDSITGQYLSGKLSIPVPKTRKTADPKKTISIEGANSNNLQNVTVHFPIGLMTCITGVSGSGKSTLINDTLYPVAAHLLNRAGLEKHGNYTKISGLEHLDKVVCIDQSPIGRTPRSNAATYTGLFSHIRDLFAGTQEARTRGYAVGRFSFNVKGGRCEACQGDGLIKVEMHFLADIYVMCDVCKGKRYNNETLQILYKGKNIHDVLELTIEDGLAFFEAIPAIARKLQTLMDVGLSYLKLGQSATTLSGGEAQRIKLAKELSRRDTGNTLYILDEPTTGLHFHDVKQLLEVLSHLKERGNTILVIEHNLDVIKTADWIVDLGPEGGDGGGQILVAGTPETVAKTKNSYTGRFLKPIL